MTDPLCKDEYAEDVCNKILEKNKSEVEDE